MASNLNFRMAPMSRLLAGQFKRLDGGLAAKFTRLLRAIRTHLGMDVAFIAEFSAGRRVFRHVDAEASSAVVAGASDPLEDSLCQRVVDSRLPELLRNASAEPAVQEVLASREVSVGAHLSVPIRLADGSTYGTLCCFSHTPDYTLGDRDLAMMRVFAEVVAEEIQSNAQLERARAAAEARVNAVLGSEDHLVMFFQPIYHVANRRVVGFEALSRFFCDPKRSPDQWFKEAADVGLDLALEAKAARLALAALPHLPVDAYVSINLSPHCILEGDLASLLAEVPLDRVLIEVTEHAAIDHYSDIAAVISPLRERGLKIAVDDAGAGYASFRHILSLAPDVIKLDVSITRDIDTDPKRRALAASLIGFANATHSRIVAEGVETEAELAMLRKLGVNKAQGYFIGKPMPLPEAARFSRDA